MLMFLSSLIFHSMLVHTPTTQHIRSFTLWFPIRSTRQTLLLQMIHTRRISSRLNNCSLYCKCSLSFKNYDSNLLLFTVFPVYNFLFLFLQVSQNLIILKQQCIKGKLGIRKNGRRSTWNSSGYDSYSLINQMQFKRLSIQRSFHCCSSWILQQKQQVCAYSVQTGAHLAANSNGIWQHLISQHHSSSLAHCASARQTKPVLRSFCLSGSQIFN